MDRPIKPAETGGGPPEKRIGYLDYLRLLAVFLVVAAHGMSHAAASLPVQSPGWYVLTGLSNLSLCCNLLFVMISGALALGGCEQPLGQYYFKRFTKIAVPLGMYYGLYLFNSGRLSRRPDELAGVLLEIISGPNELVPHFWLVYVLAGLYLAAPFLRFMLKAMPVHLMKGLTAVILAGFLFKSGLAFGGRTSQIDSFLFSWTGVFLLGYLYAGDSLSGWHRRLMMAGGLSGAVILALPFFRPDGAALVVNTSLVMVLFASALFLFFFWGREKLRNPGRLVQVISKYSYSILLIHWFMLFVVVEQKLGLGQELWLLPAKIMLALLFSLAFAIAFDNTAVRLIQWILEKIYGILAKK